MKKTFQVPVYWEMQGSLKVSVETEGLTEEEIYKAAIKAAKEEAKDCPLPEGSYVEETFEVETNPEYVFPI